MALVQRSLPAPLTFGRFVTRRVMRVAGSMVSMAIATAAFGFTSRVFSGNPAAVVPLNEWLPDATLQA